MDRAKMHPLILAAAAGVLVFSLVGAAALTGVLPLASSKTEAAPALNGLPERSEAPSAPAKSTAAPVKSAAAPVQKPKSPQVAQTQVAQAKCEQCGVLQAVQAVEVKGDTSGAGAVLGGVAGAVVGNQFGRGDTRTVLTVAGAAGGALAGNEIEKHTKKHTVYRVTVKMDDGSLRTLSQSAAPTFGIGERVRINGVTLERA
jgi:outer membrane lipoprotein SlyB